MVLTILKIIGIILLVILGILLFILLNILFVPIRYRLEGSYDKEGDLEAKVTWLPFLFKATLSYHNDKFLYIIRLFGGVIMTNTDARISFIGRKLFSEDNSQEDFANEDEEVSYDNQDISLALEPDPSKEEVIFKSDTIAGDNKKRKTSLWEIIRNKIKNIRENIKNFIKKLKTLNQKREDLLKVYHSKRFEIAKKDVILYLKKLFGIIKPDKLEGRVHFGFDDPALTGQVTGVAAMFLPLYDGYFLLQPEFEYSCLDGYVKGKGKILLFSILILGIKIIFNKNLIKVMKRVKTIIER
ncbi:MAG: hypothetical protein ACI4GW_11210 [Lachnospiraceae bacterium]